MMRSAFKHTPSAFSLIELMVALLIVSALGISITQFMRKQSTSLKESTSSRSLERENALISTFLRNDIAQAVYLNPACDDSLSGASMDCDLVPYRAGIMPIPGTSKESLNSISSYGLPSNLYDSSFSYVSDALRILEYDFEGQFDCTLDRSIANNPPTSTESFTVSADCASQLETGKIYVMVEEINSTLYSNVFQITDISGTDIEISSSATSDSPLFNQVGGLGDSGFSNEARIFPVRIVELAVSSSGGLYRRITSPSSSDSSGIGSWKAINDRVETVQYFYTDDSSVEYYRALTSGVDPVTIRGVSPWFVTRASTTSRDSDLVDNPMTSAVENDKYERNQVRFFVAMHNFSE